MITEFMDMLKYKRPASSQFEELFIDEFITPLEVMEDSAGNLFKSVPYPNGDKPEIMWSCHTDTVHGNDGYQTVKLVGQYIKLHDKESNCLGADDASGVWLCMEMIRAGKPGLYVFHRGEELGGVGSTHVANVTPEAVEGIKCCIALDRMNTRDIITKQGWSRCCSDEFADSLADALGGKFEKSEKGVFTDSANYTDVIGECTNLSVGYEKQHSMFEQQDFNFLKNLRLKLIAIDYNELVFKRKAGEDDPDAFYRSAWRGYDDVDNPYASYYPDTTDEKLWSNWDDKGNKRAEHKERSDMWDMVNNYPDIITELLTEYGVTESDLADTIYMKTGDLV